MPLQTKIVLSDKELALVKNADWILTKQVIIQKVYQILEECISTIDKEIRCGEGYPTQPPKISKGENYLGLPYVTLDHPRLFDKEDIFAIRTMFWWGNFFSITFHVAGIYKSSFAEKIIANYSKMPADIFLCVHKEQWHHHFEEDNYIPVSALSLQQMSVLLHEKEHIKLAVKYELDDINNIRELLIEGYKKIGKLIS